MLKLTGCSLILKTVPESCLLTGEEQKEVCKMATIAMSGQFDFDHSLARCYVADMSVSNSVIAPGMYDVLGVAVMNFDGFWPNSRECDINNYCRFSTGSGQDNYGNCI